ncbi:MAG: polysaccharide biosynthesis/export family protein [Bacteroidales bacterium]|nr:polysaccharide biosynthesis/export family protein [Bacteroidales bacterium]
MIKRIINIFASAAIIAMMSSCSSASHIAYMQDVTSGDNLCVNTFTSIITVMPGDEISIIVNSQDPELSQLFNLPYAGQRIGAQTSQTGNFTQGVCGYFVDSEGCIDFPVLGKLKVAGLSREGVASMIKQNLKESNQLQDAVVTVNFMNLAVSVMGEVMVPGRYYIDRDEVTILDALSRAGDLTIYGIREKVMVIRNEGGAQKTYTVDLTSASNLFSSPVYYLRQNDVVYVQPNSKKVGESTVNGNNTRSASFWISLSSLAASIATVVINAVK